MQQKQSLSLEHMAILTNTKGSSRSEIAYLASKMCAIPTFDIDVARKTIDHLLTVGFLRKEQGLFWLSRTGEQALKQSFEQFSKISILGRANVF